MVKVGFINPSSEIFVKLSEHLPECAWIVLGTDELSEAAYLSGCPILEVLQCL